MGLTTGARGAKAPFEYAMNASEIYKALRTTACNNEIAAELLEDYSKTPYLGELALQVIQGVIEELKDTSAQMDAIADLLKESRLRFQARNLVAPAATNTGPA